MGGVNALEDCAKSLFSDRIGPHGGYDSGPLLPAQARVGVNPNCYLEQESEFALAARAAGIAYADLINRIAELATARYAR